MLSLCKSNQHVLFPWGNFGDYSNLKKITFKKWGRHWCRNFCVMKKITSPDILSIPTPPKKNIIFILLLL